MSNLAKRWVVAGVGIPVVVSVLYLGGLTLSLLVAVIAVLGSREYCSLAREGGASPFNWLVGVMVACVVLLAAWRPMFLEFGVSMLGFLGLGSGVVMAFALAHRSPRAKPLSAVATTLFGVLYVGLPMAVILLLHELPNSQGWSGASTIPSSGLLVVALPLAATWLGDAMALFTGTAWGKGGLAPQISPNKSWAGVWGGIGGAVLAATVWYYVTVPWLPELPVRSPIIAGSIGAVIGVVGIVGDLVESLFKREAGVKDSGGILPGHGGILDRLDSLLFTLPTTYIALLMLDSSL